MKNTTYRINESETEGVIILNNIVVGDIVEISTFLGGLLLNREEFEVVKLLEGRSNLPYFDEILRTTIKKQKYLLECCDKLSSKVRVVRYIPTFYRRENSRAYENTLLMEFIRPFCIEYGIDEKESYLLIKEVEDETKELDITNKFYKVYDEFVVSRDTHRRTKT